MSACDEPRKIFMIDDSEYSLKYRQSAIVSEMTICFGEKWGNLFIQRLENVDFESKKHKNEYFYKFMIFL